MGLDENNLPSGYYRRDGSSGGDVFSQLMGGFKADTDAYVNDLIKSAEGDKDFAIKQIKREHDLALSNNDAQTAEFLEGVADKLEEKIGRIPYDYNVAVERTNLKANTALNRLSEDEKVWKQEKAITDQEAKTTQQEGLLKRGILSGTREGAQGLAGSEVRKLDTDLQKQLEAYDRALGRSQQDIKTEQTQSLADLKTGVRRDVIDTQDKAQFGEEAQKRLLESKKKQYEAIRKAGYETAPTYATTRMTQMYG